MSKSNAFKYVFISSLFSTAILFTSGNTVQVFMEYLGCSAGEISVYSSVIQIAQILVMFACAFLGDKIKKVRNTLALFILFMPTVALSMILAASGFFQTVSSKYAVIFIGSVITNLLLGFYNIFCYKLPYYIFDMKNYGKLMAVSGFCYSGISVGFTALVTFLTKKFNYLSVTVAAFWISALFFVISAVLTFSYKLKEIENEGKKQTENENQSAPAPVGNTIYKQALFYKTLPAHLLRGIGTGIFLLMSVIGIYGGILNTQTAVALTFIYAASSATGNLLYSVGLKWINDRKILTLSGLFFLFAVPVCGISTNLILFYVFYFIANALNITLGIGVPAVVVQTVDYAYIGTYTSWRMLIFTLGIALPGFFLEPMMKATGIFIPLLISGVCICVSCFMYGLYLKETR